MNFTIIYSIYIYYSIQTISLIAYCHKQTHYKVIGQTITLSCCFKNVKPLYMNKYYKLMRLPLRIRNLTKPYQVYLKEQVFHHTTQFPIYKVVIIGGPCAYFIGQNQKVKSEIGYRVFSVPKIPTMVVVAGGMIFMVKFNTQQKQNSNYCQSDSKYTLRIILPNLQLCQITSIVLGDHGVFGPYVFIQKSSSKQLGISKTGVWLLQEKEDMNEQFYQILQLIGLNSSTHWITMWPGLRDLMLREYQIKKPYKLERIFEEKVLHTVRAVQELSDWSMYVHISLEKYLIKPPISQWISKFRLLTSRRASQSMRTSDMRTISHIIYNAKVENQNADYPLQIRKALTSLQYLTLKEQSLDCNITQSNEKILHFAYHNISYAIDIYDKIDEKLNVHLLRLNAQAQNIQIFVPKFIEFIKDVKKDRKYSLREIAIKR